MKSTTETLHSEIYPALYDNLADAFPEFEFVKTGSGYKSNNARKLSGQLGDSRGKVYVYEYSPGYIKDYREGSMSIWDYVQDRDALTDNRDVFRRLVELAGLSLPDQQLTPEAIERIERARRVADMWEAANDFFIRCLSGVSSEHAKTTRAEQVRSYLSRAVDQGGRGYAYSLFRLPGQQQSQDVPKMELGYIPGLFELQTELAGRGYSSEEVSSLVDSIRKAGSRVGSQNILTFPYRDHIGRIRGMAFRSIEKDDEPKYLYSSFTRSEVLFNLRSLSRDKDLVIVESPLDSLHAAALGIKNVTALGGSGDTLNKVQVDLAVRAGATKLTLLLDNDSREGIDRAGAIGTDKAVAFLQKEYPNLRVYVGQYPDGIKDLDELLVKAGKEAFYKIKDEAVESWRYQLDRLFVKYARLQPEGEPLTDKQKGDFLTEIVGASAKLSAIERDQFIHTFTSDPVISEEYGITRQSVEQTVDLIRKAEFDRNQSERLQSLLKDAKKASDSGEVGQALDLLSDRTKEIKARNKADAFSKLSTVRSEQQIKDRIKNRPVSLNSGYVVDRDALMIPSAAISILAGATSHGKSILIANLALNLAGQYPNKTFHIFSYEVDEERYLINLLNSYIGDDGLAFNNRESIEHYFRDQDKIERNGNRYSLFKDSDKVSKFHTRRVEFFANLIESGRIKVHYVTYDSDALADAIRYLNSSEPVGAVLVDYMQLIYTPTGKLRNPSRQEEIKQMCIDFKDLALETGLPLIFGAQFNREVNNLAQMHATKLGEAGDLERIADLIVGIWNNSRRPAGTLSKSDELVIDERVGKEPNQKTWYVEILKRRGGRVEVWDIWDYLPNAAKVTSAMH